MFDKLGGAWRRWGFDERAGVKEEKELAGGYVRKVGPACNAEKSVSR